MVGDQICKKTKVAEIQVMTFYAFAYAFASSAAKCFHAERMVPALRPICPKHFDAEVAAAART